MPAPEGMPTYTDYTCSYAKAERDPGCYECSMPGGAETSGWGLHTTYRSPMHVFWRQICESQSGMVIIPYRRAERAANLCLASRRSRAIAMT